MADASVNPLEHFGKQVKKERLAHGWSLPELAKRSGIDAGHWSRIERAIRPPTKRIAAKCDEVFPERRLVHRVLLGLPPLGAARLPVLDRGTGQCLVAA